MKNLKIFTIKCLIVALISLLTSLVILNYTSILEFIDNILVILRPFIYGASMAYLMNPLYSKINNKTRKFKHSESISIALTVTIFTIVLSGVCLIIIPQSIQSISDILSGLPENLEKSKEWLNSIVSKYDWLNTNNMLDLDKILKDNVVPNIELIISNLLASATYIGKTVFDIIMGVFISVFILANKNNFKEHSKLLLKELIGSRVSNIIIEELKIADKMFSGFLVGKVIDSLIIGILCFISMTVLKLPYVAVISVIIGVTNIIPIAGPFIGAIPGVIFVFSVSPVKSLYFLILIIIIQQLDGNYIGPKCIGSATNLNTFWVLFAIIFFGGLWGLIGMVIGVPLLAVIFDIIQKVVSKISYIRELKLTKKDEENK